MIHREQVQTIIKYTLIVMQGDLASFTIKYLPCREESHCPEKANLICLSKLCQQSPLICSLCCLDKHKGHHFKPLKIHLESLYQRYRDAPAIYAQQLRQLQQRRASLMVGLRQAVESISGQICKLQEAIERAYLRIKQELQENAWRRSRFAEFYLTMLKDNYGDPSFQLANYLFNDHVAALTDRDIFAELTHHLQEIVSGIAGSIFKQSELPIIKHRKQQKQGLRVLYPANIYREGSLFTQTNYTINAPHLCLLDEDILQWGMHRLRVSVQAFGKFSFIAFGIMKREEFLKANFLFRGSLASQYFSSDSKGKGVAANFLQNVSTSTKIDLQFTKNQIKASTNCSNLTFTIAEPGQCFFFVIQGNTKIKIAEMANSQE